jgi:hypothetical protein
VRCISLQEFPHYYLNKTRYYDQSEIKFTCCIVLLIKESTLIVIISGGFVANQLLFVFNSQRKLWANTDLRYVIANKEPFWQDGCANLFSDRSIFSLYWDKALHTLCNENVWRQPTVSPLILLRLLINYLTFNDASSAAQIVRILIAWKEARFWLLTAVLFKNAVLWDVTQCHLASSFRLFEKKT